MILNSKMDINKTLLDILTVSVSGILGTISVGGYCLVLSNFVQSLDPNVADQDIELNELIKMSW